MEKFKLFKEIINDSHIYELDTYGILTVKSYRSGETVTVDLNKLDEEMFEHIQPDEDWEDEDEDF